jgi:MSHA biogenesis protein MshI
MGFFSKRRKSEGFIAFAPRGGGICAVRVEPVADGKPLVHIAAFAPAEPGQESLALDKLGRELKAASYRCGTTLTMHDYQVLSVDAPNVPQEELKTAVRWRLKDMLDFHVDDATIDVLEIPVNKNAPSQSRQMFVVAARNAVIAGTQTLFAGAEAPLSVIDVPEMAQRNITSLVQGSDARGVAMLSFDADGGLLTVCADGELYLTRRMDVTLAQLMEPEPARMGAHDKITLELQRSLDHFDRQYHYINVSRLVLAPNSAPGLHEYLAQNLYMPVEKLDLASVFDISATPELQDVDQQQRFFRCLGAALRREEVPL